MIPWIGDYKANSTVRYPWATNGSNGASITRSTNGSIRVYKGTSTTERTSSSGITDTEDFDSLTGLHVLSIDLSDNTDSGFYATGNDYFVVLQGAVIDSQTVNCPLFSFSIENRAPRVDLVQISGSAVSTTTAQLGVNVVQISGDSTSADNLESYTDGTTPMPVNATQISGDTTAADNAEAFFDGTGYAGTNNVIPTVTTVTNTVTANVTQISGDSTAADNLESAADGTGYNLGGGAVVAASVTGAVGSVAGSVGGNVAGSVGSVAGNVGGNVAGSVGSVAAGGISAASLTTAALDAIADALLLRDWTDTDPTIADSAYNALNALRFLRNVWSTETTPGSVEVFGEDGTTSVWTRSITTDAAAEPITGAGS
mgnify:CR=1 FL=1